MASINSFQFPVQQPQLTTDVYYLTKDLDNYTISFGIGASGFILDTEPPFASAISIAPTALAFTINTPVSLTTNTIRIDEIARSYLQDYYFRINLNTYNIALGNVLTEQTHYVEIWNAWLESKTLSSIGNVDLTELNITINSVVYDPTTNTTGYTPASIPYTHGALEATRGIITIPALGIPTLNGYYSFNFIGESPDLYITGQRIILWPYNTLRKFQEKRAYLTDIILSRSDESRIPLREVPRLSVEYSNVFLSTEEYTSAKQLATEIAHLAVAVPQWSDLVKVTGIVAGQDTIYFNTTGMELIEGNAVVLWKSWDFWEIVELLDVLSDRIVLKKALLNSFAFCWITPIIIGYTDNGISLSQNDNKDLTGSIAVTSEYCYYEATDSFAQFKGLPIWERTAVLSGGLQNKYSRTYEVSETPTGLVQRFDVETYSRQITKLSTYVSGKSSLNNLRREFDFLQGRYKTFWLPTFKGDIVPITAVIAGTGTVTVRYTNKVTYPIDYIYISGKDAGGNTIGECFKITGAANNFNGTETLTFETVATKTFTSIKTISIMLKVRLDADIVTTQHLGRDYLGNSLYMIDIPVKEVA